MAKYEKYRRKSPPKQEMSPLWRGIGCILMLVVPAISYLIAYAFLQEAKNLGWVPQELLGRIKFPEWMFGVPFLDTIARFFGSLKDPWAMLIFFFATLFILSGLISLVYSAFYQLLGPPRYSDKDAPPPRWKGKETKR
jgi:hypothetical protein